MRAFQYIALALLALLIFATARNLLRGRTRPAVGIMWLVVWCAAAVAMVVPDATTAVAQTLGIERGADFIFYCAVLGGLVGFFLVYQQFRRLNRQITLLTRELAIARADEPDGEAEQEADADGA